LKTKKLFFYTLAFFLIISPIACGKTQEEIPTEPAATELAPDPNGLPDDVRKSRCGDKYWFNQTNTPEFAGFDHMETLLTQSVDGSRAHQTWLVELAQININDRVVYFPNLQVNQLRQIEGKEKPVQELEPDKWIRKALELSHKAPSVTINLELEWKYVAINGYSWYVIDDSVSCK